jgi:CubicO group peptidase (beta-lactamase class C family)
MNLDIVDSRSAFQIEIEKLVSDAVISQGSSDKRKSDDKIKHQVPGVEILVRQGGELIYSKALGASKRLDEEKGVYSEGELIAKSVYDVGSLTKILLTAPLVYLLSVDNLISYDFRISRYLPSFSTLGKERMTINHLLSNTSGLPNSINLSRSLMPSMPKDAPELSRRVAQDKLLKELPKGKITNLPGKASEESPIGYMILSYVLEQITGVPIDKMFKKISRSLGLQSIDFIDWELLRREKFDPDLGVIVPTRFCPWRDRILHGECSDELAWYFSGVASHSGLFSTLSDIAAIGNEFILGTKGLGKLFSGASFKDKFQETLFEQGVSKSPVFNLFGMIKETVNLQNGGTSEWFGLDSDTGVSLWLNPQLNLTLTVASTQIQVSKDLKPHRELVKKLKSFITGSF